MAARIESIERTSHELDGALKNGNPSIVAQKFHDFMRLLTECQYYLPRNCKLGEVDSRELFIARDTLEKGALWSVEIKDQSGFERFYLQLRCYYFDYDQLLPASVYKLQIIGLYLLYLLSQNRLAEFHTELELLSLEQLQNIYIKHPTSLEQFVMEGSYNKIFLSKGNVPASNYNYFIDILIDTVREEIASCFEKAYHSLPVNDAAKMLMLGSATELQMFATKRGWSSNEYGKYVLNTPSNGKQESQFIGNTKLMKQSLGYVRELEKIV